MATTLPQQPRPMRILMATEYLPPFISGIANRCKNLVEGYRKEGHSVAVYSIRGAPLTTHPVPSIPNFLYIKQRMFILPPLDLMLQLLNPFQPMQYDIVHVVSPLCFPFMFMLPLFWLRGVKIYISYHVLLQYYKDFYFQNVFLRALAELAEFILVRTLFWPMVAFADVIGIPSKTADSFVFESKRRIHVMMSGLDTDLFVPYNEEEALEKDDNISKDEGCETGGEVDHNTTSIEAAATTSAKTSNIIKNPPPSSSSTTTTPPPPPRPVMCYIGRLATEKMIHFLVSTLAHPDLANACLIIVGDGPELQPLYNQAVEIVGADNIYRHSFVDKAHEDPSISQSGSHLHGEVDPDYIFQLARGGGENNSNKLYRVIFTGMVHSETKIAQLYARSNIFVTASPSETFGFTVAESLSCGTPAVAVKEGAFKTVYSMIDDWLFKEGDVQDFVDKINLVMKLYKDPEVTRLCRERCRKIAVDGFSVKAAVKDLLGVYEEIVFGEQSKHIRECSQLVRERQATDGAHEIVDNGRDSEKKNE